MSDNKVKTRIREWRELRGYSILELSRAAEVNRQNLYKIEDGKTGGIDFGVLSRIAKVLQVKPSELIAP